MSKMTVPKYRGTERKCLDAFTEGQSTESSVPVPGTVKSLHRTVFNAKLKMSEMVTSKLVIVKEGKIHIVLTHVFQH